MSIPTHILSTLQRAGQAVFDAHTELTAATKSQASRVSESLEMNPFALENDALFSNWKDMARLAQEVQNVEAQLRALYATASAMSADEGLLVTDVPPLPAPEARVRGRRVAASAAPIAAPSVVASAGDTRLKGNNAKVMNCLGSMLNQHEFTKVRQSVVADAAGIPKGSINLAMRQLTALRLIEEGNKGHYRLV